MQTNVKVTLIVALYSWSPPRNMRKTFDWKEV